MKVLLIPDWQGCTIITDNGYCTIQGLPNDIVDKVFVSEIPISNGIGLSSLSYLVAAQQACIANC